MFELSQTTSPLFSYFRATENRDQTKSHSLLFFSSCRAELKCISWFEKHSKNTVNSLCCSVTAGNCRSLMASPKGGASQQSCRPTKTESCLNTYFHWEGGRGSSASFNQDLKTVEPLIKSPLCTFILFLWRLCWLMSSTLILLFWSAVSDISALLITRWSSCDVGKKRKKPIALTPPSPSHHHIQMHEVRVVRCASHFFFFLLLLETVPLIFRVLS